jgi:hypothetical protein
VHLVVRRGTEVWIARELGHAGVGCDSTGLYATHFDVESLTVRDVLFGREPEILLRTPGGAETGGGDWLLVCTTDTSPPRCNDVVVSARRVRYRRPNVVLGGDAETVLDVE